MGVSKGGFWWDFLVCKEVSRGGFGVVVKKVMVLVGFQG
jgi:hypothetical protein